MSRRNYTQSDAEKYSLAQTSQNFCHVRSRIRRRRSGRRRKSWRLPGRPSWVWTRTMMTRARPTFWTQHTTKIYSSEANNFQLLLLHADTIICELKHATIAFFVTTICLILIAIYILRLSLKFTTEASYQNESYDSVSRKPLKGFKNAINIK